MNWNFWARQIHRWLSIVFTAIPIGIAVALNAGEKPANWVYLTPLFPLAVLALTGLYLFVLPYALRRRGG
jgi:ABC-type polysaccharide/polyol phosphate export permease